jgi:hypothetical protein
MKIFKCPNCNKEFNRKSNFEYHIKGKKRPCIVLEHKKEAKLAETEAKLAKTEAKLAKTEQKLANIKTENQYNFTFKDDVVSDNFININPYDVILGNTNNTVNNDENKYICKYCNTIFGHKSSLTKHEKERCKTKKYCDELEVLKQKLKTLSTENEELKKEMKELKHTTINTTNNNNNITNNTTNNKNNKINNGVINNTNNTNNTINVQLVQFGNENIDDIDTKEALDVYLKSTGGNIISNILKLINLNEKYPQNHNICISDLSRELVKIFDGKKFIIKKFKNIKSDILSKLIQNTYRLVDKIENDELIYKTADVKSKMNINNVSLKLIDGCLPEDIVKDEIKENNKLLKCKIKNEKKKKKKQNLDSDDSVSDDEEIELNLNDLLRIEHLENKQPGLLEIALERLKEELYNGKILICE